jgi:putative transposase
MTLREIMPGVEHRQHRGLNNRSENSHQPSRWRERIMKRLLSTHDQVANLFRHPANANAADRREPRAHSFMTWVEVTGVAAGF